MKSDINKIYTSESVGRGHPDKICDQISDKVLDECLRQDKNSRVACEVFASNRLIVVGGEIATKGYVDVIKCAWDILLKCGYTYNDFTIISNVNKQSPDIANKVNNKELGAGDQGVVYGYATNETKQMLPLSYVLATDIIKELDKIVEKGNSGLKYDMKSQVSLYYDKKNKPIIDNVVISIQHEEKTTNKKIQDTCNLVINKVFKKYSINQKEFKKYINYGGRFVIGGPIGDTGLTGRKLAVDTYGSIANHGGGAFSGKDYSKVDRTCAYYARYIAKNIVANKLADKVQVQLCFVIGYSFPLNIYVDCFGTEKIPLQKINKIVNEKFKLKISEMVKALDLTKPCFSKTSIFGHFTDSSYSWEKIKNIR